MSTLNAFEISAASGGAVRDPDGCRSDMLTGAGLGGFFGALAGAIGGPALSFFGGGAGALVGIGLVSAYSSACTKT